VYHRIAAASAAIGARCLRRRVVGASIWGTIAMMPMLRLAAPALALMLAAPAFALMLAAPAAAACTDDVCGSLQTILVARSGNFAKLKGKPTVDARGDQVWQGTHGIGNLIGTCYVYKRGEGGRYEYRCDSSAFGAQPQSADKARQIAAEVKAALRFADPAVVWFEDSASRALADVDGFKGTEGWYGGYARTKAMVVRVETVISDATGNATIVTIFAKPLTRRDLK
jgi:hypothetical protein